MPPRRSLPVSLAADVTWKPVPCYGAAMPMLSPIESEFASTEEAEAHDRWFRAKVEAALADSRPKVPHDEAMARARALIESKRRAAPVLDR